MQYKIVFLNTYRYIDASYINCAISKYQPKTSCSGVYPPLLR